MLTIYTGEDCVFCEKALKLLDDEKRQYSVIDFEEEQQEVLNEIKLAHDWKTVPMIYHRVKNVINFIGGYTDLVEYFEQEKAR